MTHLIVVCQRQFAPAVTSCEQFPSRFCLEIITSTKAVWGVWAVCSSTAVLFIGRRLTVVCWGRSLQRSPVCLGKSRDGCSHQNQWGRECILSLTDKTVRHKSQPNNRNWRRSWILKCHSKVALLEQKMSGIGDMRALYWNGFSVSATD